MKVFLCISLFITVWGQEGTGGGDGHGHLPGHTKVVVHQPDLHSPIFFTDPHMNALIMKTPTGCYVEHIKLDLSTVEAAVLKTLEIQMTQAVGVATTFLQVIFPEALQHFSTQIQAACEHTHLYHWH